MEGIVIAGALLTSAGRRVELLRLLQARVQGPVVAGDLTSDAPAALLADGQSRLPAVRDPAYLEQVLELCILRGLNLVIPTIDPELEVLARSRDRFANRGIYVAVSDITGVQDSFDKASAADRLGRAGIPGVPTARWVEGQQPPFAFPVVVKPSRGSSGAGVRTIADPAGWTGPPGGDWLVQPLVVAPEVTIDVVTDDGHGVLAVGARRRLKVRGGEVERGVTIDAEPFLELAARTARAFALVGPWNLQVFDSPGGPLVGEVNARFGGGMPLSEHAGAGLIDLVVTRSETGVWPRGPVRIAASGWRMARYDASVFRKEEALPW